MYIVVMIISIITNIITSITNLWNSLLKNWVTNKIGMGKRDRYSITWGGKKITGINRIGNFSMARDIVDITCYGSYCRSFAPGLIGELSFVLCLDRTSEFAMDLTNDFIIFKLVCCNISIAFSLSSIACASLFVAIYTRLLHSKYTP